MGELVVFLEIHTSSLVVSQRDDVAADVVRFCKQRLQSARNSFEHELAPPRKVNNAFQFKRARPRASTARQGGSNPRSMGACKNSLNLFRSSILPSHIRP